MRSGQRTILIEFDSFEQAVAAYERPAGIHGEIRYAAPLWEATTITALARGLQSAITALSNG
ncbi:hypothetical protein [Nocardia carnea]|uniref:DUF1330 domain-containing protein n=1 Tax=Nocardia carnea TaxID=37328 RepID=A0ABW7TH53_9NOCA|nr:hypothetical protein [Nocardia carnea]